jgi:hypothetical protein
MKFLGEEKSYRFKRVLEDSSSMEVKRIGSYFLMGTDFMFGVMESFGKTSGFSKWLHILNVINTSG